MTTTGRRKAKAAPSREPQRIDRHSWYYETRKCIQIVSWETGRCSAVDIPWRMLLESAIRCGRITEPRTQIRAGRGGKRGRG